MSAPGEDHMEEGEEVIHDDERAPLADEEKVPLSTDGSREDIVDPDTDPEKAQPQEDTDVKKTMVTTTSSSQDDGCCARCCRCLANVPYGSLVCWVLLAAMVSSCGGSLMVALARTRDLLDNNNILPFSDALCLGVLFGMVFLGTVLLVVASISTPPTSFTVFNSSAKNCCARVLNIIMVLLLVFLVVVWAAIAVVLAVPVVYIVLLHILYNMHKDDPSGCVDLKNFGLATNETTTETVYCGERLKIFYEKVFTEEDIMVCYSIALVASILVVLSLVLFLICTTANYIHLRESRHMDYNAYKNDVAGAKNAVVDTRM